MISSAVIIFVGDIGEGTSTGDHVDEQIQPGNQGIHVGGTVLGGILDAVHHEIRDTDGDLRFKLVWAWRGTGTRVSDQLDAFGLFGNEGRHVLAAEGPVDAGAQVEDVGGPDQWFAFDLFGSNVVGGALDARFDGSQPATLSQVDDANRAVFGNNDVGGFDVAMEIALVVHGVESSGDHAKDQHEIKETSGGGLFEANAWAILHEQQDLRRLKPAAFSFLDLINFSDIGVIDPAANAVLVFDLLDHAFIGVIPANDMFEGADFAGPSVPDGEDEAGSADTDSLNDLVAIIVGRLDRSHRDGAISCNVRYCWQFSVISFGLPQGRLHYYGIFSIKAPSLITLFLSRPEERVSITTSKALRNRRRLC